MTYRVSLTTRAERDRERAYGWYSANYSEAFAIRWYNDIVRALRSLTKNPDRYPKAVESRFVSYELFELICGKGRNKYRILYRIHQDIVVVLHIRHSAQGDLTKDDFEPGE